MAENALPSGDDRTQVPQVVGTEAGSQAGQPPGMSPYVMDIDMRVLDHLGLRLYSNASAVLSEAVANAWDADAARVQVTLSPNLIIIEDDGYGMNLDVINKRFLTVGYDKRGTEGARSPKGRLFMGRKGIGKLSLFSIADVVTVHTTRDGEEHAFRMATADIETALTKVPREDYRPVKVPFEGPRNGTRIVLTEIKRPRVGSSESALRKRIARRFSVIGHEFPNGDRFDVVLNDRPIGPDDREDLKGLEFIWMFGAARVDLATQCPNLRCRFVVSAEVDGGKGWHLRGWIGAAPQPKNLRNDESGSMNGIVVVARGRLIQENILDKLGFDRLFAHYVTGQVEADFLDVETEADIATSDRQRLIEDDERYVALLRFLRQTLLDASDQWSERRNQLRGDEARTANPALQEWIEGLPTGQRVPARKMIDLVAAIPLQEESERKSLFRSSILAFERLRLHEAGHEIGNLTDLTAEKLLPLLSDLASLEGSMYRDIVRERLAVIGAFTGLVDDEAREKVLQQFLFDNMWLLDPGWERATGSDRMEEQLRTQYEEFASGLTDEQSLGRIDIRYRKNAGQHIVVELKRADRTLSIFELGRQGYKYKSALESCVKAQEGHETSPLVELVFVLGRQVREEADDPKMVRDQLRSINARVVYYEQLIRSASNAYSEFFERSQQADRIDQIVQRLRDS